MRNAFVVLVSLCIGLVSGFIVPSSAPEHIVTESVSETDDRDVVEKPNTSSPKKVELHQIRNNIDEKDLYEYATEKKNNQSERAFVYINQKYNKKPIRSKFIKILAKPGSVFALPTTPAPLPPAPQTPCPSAFDSTPNFNSKFQGFHLGENKDQQEISSYFSAPDMFRCKFNKETQRKENANIQVQVPAPQRVEEPREYFELLKSPLLRPVNRKIYHDNVPDMSPLSHSNKSYRENHIQKNNMKSQYVSTALAVVPQNEIQKNYGFNNAFIARPDYEPKELSNRVEDVNFEDDFVNDDGFQGNFVNNQGEDKLLDKYLKDTLEDTPMTSDNDKVRNNLPQCAKEDCISELRKKPLKNNGLLIKPACQCERPPSVIQADPFVSKDRSLRQQPDHQNTPLKSSEVVYYEDMLSEDSNILKQDDDVVRPPSRINFTPSQ